MLPAFQRPSQSSRESCPRCQVGCGSIKPPWIPCLQDGECVRSTLCLVISLHSSCRLTQSSEHHGRVNCSVHPHREEPKTLRLMSCAVKLIRCHKLSDQCGLFAFSVGILNQKTCRIRFSMVREIVACGRATVKRWQRCDQTYLLVHSICHPPRPGHHLLREGTLYRGRAFCPLTTDVSRSPTSYHSYATRGGQSKRRPKRVHLDVGILRVSSTLSLTASMRLWGPCRVNCITPRAACGW